MVEVGRIYTIEDERAGSVIWDNRRGREAYLPKYYLVIYDDGQLSKDGKIRLYYVLDDEGKIGPVDTEDFEGERQYFIPTDKSIDVSDYERQIKEGLMQMRIKKNEELYSLLSVMKSGQEGYI